MLVQRWHYLLYVLLAYGHLPRVSRQSRLSANGNGDNEMILGVVHNLLAFTLWLRKTAPSYCCP